MTTNSSSSTTTTTTTSSSSIETTIHLSVDDKTRHWLYLKSIPRTDAERDASTHKTDVGGATVPQRVTIHNGRGNDDLTLDEASFELVDCPTVLSTKDFYAMQQQPQPQPQDDKQGDGKKTTDSVNITEKYYEEVSNFVKQKIKCDKVICLHHQVRNDDKTGDNGIAGYATGGPHTDSSPVSSDELALSLMDGDDATTYERYLYVNLWRNISDDGPIENDHLAMLDERTTVKPDDYIVKDLYGDGYNVVQYGLNARHASQHKWYYFPHMTKGEALLFKQMDSDWTKSGRICFHMSVHDDTTVGTRSRESIEVRMVCYWKKAASGVNSMPTKDNLNVTMIRDPEEIVKNTALMSYSTWQLFKFVIFRILGIEGGGTVAATSDYTGNPRDYLVKFTNVVNAYPSLPSFGKSWVKSQMKQYGSDPMVGITHITKALVEDQMGYQGTKDFSADEKKEITGYLLSDESYIKAARKHLAALVV